MLMVRRELSNVVMATLLVMPGKREGVSGSGECNSVCDDKVYRCFVRND